MKPEKCVTTHHKFMAGAYMVLDDSSSQLHFFSFFLFLFIYWENFEIDLTEYYV